MDGTAADRKDRQQIRPPNQAGAVAATNQPCPSLPRLVEVQDSWRFSAPLMHQDVAGKPFSSLVLFLSPAWDGKLIHFLVIPRAICTIYVGSDGNLKVVFTEGRDRAHRFALGEVDANLFVLPAIHVFFIHEMLNTLKPAYGRFHHQDVLELHKFVSDPVCLYAGVAHVLIDASSLLCLHYAWHCHGTWGTTEGTVQKSERWHKFLQKMTVLLGLPVHSNMPNGSGAEFEGVMNPHGRLRRYFPSGVLIIWYFLTKYRKRRQSTAPAAKSAFFYGRRPLRRHSQFFLLATLLTRGKVCP